VRAIDQPSFPGGESERVALKDDRLVYRACSTAYARSLGLPSPAAVVGQTDFDLLPNAVAREQMALDSRTIYSAQADIGTLALGTEADGTARRVMIARTPVLAPGKRVRGIDIRLFGEANRALPDGGRVDIAGTAGGWGAAIDYRALVSDALQGCLIFTGSKVLFADDSAARVLGYAEARTLVAAGPVDALFAAGELERIDRSATRAHAPEAGREAGRLTLTAHTRAGQPIRLIGRTARVQWGARRATLLSFVDVALPAGMLVGAIADATTVLERGVKADGRQGKDGTCEGREHGPTRPASERLATRVLSRKLKLSRASEQRYRHYARAGADFFWELDGELRFRAVSEDIARVLGLPREHIDGRTHRQLVGLASGTDEADSWEEHLACVESHQPFRDVEFRWTAGSDSRVIRYSGLPLFDRERRFAGYRGVGCDVTAAVRQAEAVAYHASHDALTGLVNRRHFESKVGRALESSRERREAHALCFMDLDNFKIVNDTCGHQAGDELLRQLARLFDSLVRKSDVLARLGGDEFGVLLYDCDVAGALKLANQIRAELEGFQFLWEGKRFGIGVSVGLVVVDDRWEGIEPLFSAADSACYIAKNEGRNRIVVYREGEGNASNRKIATHWVEEIDAALAGERLRLARQRVVPLRGEIDDGSRYEMLLRLRLPDGKLASPRAFLPAAERYGLAAALDQRALDMTLAWLNAHPDLQRELRHVSLNLGSGAFTDESFADHLVGRISESGVPPSMLCFELAETPTIANLAKASGFMQRLSVIGCRFAIDDFGSGLSSFTWLRELPIDFLKIDGRLIRKVLDDPVDFTTVQAISDISRSMGRRTVAQFVESAELLDAVRDIGIDFAQGFHIGKPELLGRGATNGQSALTH